MTTRGTQARKARIADAHRFEPPEPERHHEHSGYLAVDTATIMLCDPGYAKELSVRAMAGETGVIANGLGIVIGYLLNPSIADEGGVVASDGAYPVDIEYETDANGRDWPVSLTISLRG